MATETPTERYIREMAEAAETLHVQLRDAGSTEEERHEAWCLYLARCEAIFTQYKEDWENETHDSGA